MSKSELKPYEEYKETGLDWLGCVPKHWEVSKNSILFREIVDTGHSDMELLSILQDKGIVKQSSTGRKIRKAEESQNYKRICDGDIGYNLMNAFMGAIGASKYEGIISPAYAVCRPKVKMNVWYYNYLFRTELYKSEFNKNSYGIMYERNRLYFDRFKSIYSIVPSMEEQEQIVKYLDHKLAKINRFIKAKKKQVELIREIVDKLTNNAINNQNTKWIRFISTVKIVRKEIERDNRKIYTQIGLYNRGRGIFHKPAVCGAELGDSRFFEVEEDCLIFSGQFAWEGAVALTSKKDIGCIASHRYPVVKGRDGIVLTSYLWALFITKFGHNLLNLCSRGAAGRNRPLNINYLLKEKIPLPSIEEQKEISLLVEKYMLMNNRLSDFIRLVSEYKNALISNVVTGKVDIRHIKVEETTDIEELDIEEEPTDEESSDTEDSVE